MSSYEQTLHLFGRWLSDELKIYTVDKITENVIRKYIDDLMVRGKYTFYVNDLSKSKNCPDRRRDYRKPVSVTTINNYIRNIRVFFNWMEREYIIRKNPMKRIRQLKYNHQAENDWASDFLSKCLSCEPDLSASASELYSAYTTYCQGYRIPPLPQTKVMSRIHKHYGVTQKRNNKAIIYTGVGVSKPESLILLEARAGECREENSEESWDDLLSA